jgi:hypothetical protein
MKAYIALGILVLLIVGLAFFIRGRKERFANCAISMASTTKGKKFTIDDSSYGGIYTDYKNTICFNNAILKMTQSKGLKDSKKRVLTLLSLPEMASVDLSNSDAVTSAVQAICTNISYGLKDTCKSIEGAATSGMIKFITQVAAKVAEPSKLFGATASCGLKKAVC